MLPFPIGSIVWATIIVVAISVGIIGLVHVADELHAGGKAQCEATHADAEAGRIAEASQQASEASAARETAFRTGSLGRLRKDFCRDCEEAH